MDKSLGFYSVNPMLKSGIPQRAQSFEPVGYSGTDYRDLESAMKELTEKRLLAVMRYCKPWTVKQIDAEWPLDTDTWLYHLKNGMAHLEKRLYETRTTDLLALTEFCGSSVQSRYSDHRHHHAAH
jgi:hypothetical protein